MFLGNFIFTDGIKEYRMRLGLIWRTGLLKILDIVNVVMERKFPRRVLDQH